MLGAEHQATSNLGSAASRDELALEVRHWPRHTCIDCRFFAGACIRRHLGLEREVVDVGNLHRGWGAVDLGWGECELRDCFDGRFIEPVAC